MNSLIHALFKYVSSASFVPDTVLGKGELDVNPKKLDLQEHTISWTSFERHLAIYSYGHMFLQNLQK